MIKCNSCESSISLQMKHSIKNNECPYCGSYLMDNKSLKVCKSISNDLLNAGFSNKIFELSIFIFKNYYKNLEEKSDIDNEELEDIEVPQFSESNEYEDQGFHKENYPSENEDEDEDDRVSRLRQLAKNNPILNKKGTVVRRVTT